MSIYDPHIGVDLDGTLAKYTRWEECQNVIGEPISPMVERVKSWLRRGIKVKIVTARVWSGHTDCERALQRRRIKEWCVAHIGCELEITSEKHPSMTELWDDKAISVEFNKGRCLWEAR